MSANLDKYYGILIDENGTPGLHSSVEQAKAQAEKEILAIYPDSSSKQIFWGTRLDEVAEAPSVYEDDEWLEDIDYRVFSAALWDEVELDSA